MQPQNNQQKQTALKSTTIGLMVGVSMLFDVIQAGLQLIPLLGQILSSMIGGVAFMTFWLWFKLKGINFAGPKRAGLLGGGFIIELIPILNALPAWTLAVTLIALDTKIKDKLPSAFTKTPVENKTK